MTETTVNGIKIMHYPSLASTNRTAMELDCTEHLLTLVADTQSEGRGRLGRSFYSYYGGLYMSVLLDPAKISVPLNLITPAAALAVKSALEAIGVKGLSIKWVNDILQNGKKVCGILTEAKSDRALIVVGIGINLSSAPAFPEDIKNKAESLGYNGDRLTPAADIASRLGEYLSSESKLITAEYAQSLAYVGQEIEVTDYANQNAKLKGKLLGVTDDCRLLIELPCGSIKTLFSGEIT